MKKSIGCEQFNLELVKYKKIIDDHLLSCLPAKNETPSVLYDAMVYSLMAGGKRIRPILCLWSYELFTKEITPSVIKAACTIELLHTYTLIHDDLPCMDDDDLRRGKPTLHKAFDEATAVLAGDALLTQVFSVLANLEGHSPSCRLSLINELGEKSGAQGVIGGQVLDLDGEKKDLGLSELERIHTNKTAKLIIASVRMGVFLAQCTEIKKINLLTSYAQKIGLAFQIADDILDEEGDSKKLGKKTKQDTHLNKATYPRLLGLKESKKKLLNYLEQAKLDLEGFGEKGVRLKKLAEFIGDRQN